MTSEDSKPVNDGHPGGPVFLVVDDDPMVRKIVTRGLRSLNPAEVVEVEDGLVAQQVLIERHIDVVVTDVVMPNMDGLELMKWAQEHCPEPLWIILSGLETFDAAVDALQLGAFDYLAKPPEVPRVRVAVRNALDQRELVRERKRLHAELEDSNALLGENVNQLQQVCRVLEDQAAVIQADLNRAEIIQRALLPQNPPLIPGWCMETLYRPGSSVGGDFYDAVMLDDNHLGVVIADAAGHGVAAAMLAVLFKLRLKHVDAEGKALAPQQVLERLNARLYNLLSTPGAFITATYIRLDLRSGHGQLASAGHPPCILGTADGSPQMLERTGPALGLEANASYWQHEFQLSAGERLMLYTDGVLEGGPDSPSAGDMATDITSSAARGDLLDRFYQDATRGLGGERDDITMLLLERADGESRFDDAAPVRERHQAEPPTTQPQPQLQQGLEHNHGFISIAGSVTWLCSQALFDCANALLEQCQELTIDLCHCEHMDSTCLGTLHEIVTSHIGAVELQGVGDLRKLFEELSMSRVLEHICADITPLPTNMTVMDAANLSPEQQGSRILSAHENLAALSTDNQEQFRAVVDSLRADLHQEE
ncbi:MAG: SpoIIE family protein phosphatase [Halioglobus sp.]